MHYSILKMPAEVLAALVMDVKSAVVDGLPTESSSLVKRSARYGVQKTSQAERLREAGDRE